LVFAAPDLDVGPEDEIDAYHPREPYIIMRSPRDGMKPRIIGIMPEAEGWSTENQVDQRRPISMSERETMKMERQKWYRNEREESMVDLDFSGNRASTSNDTSSSSAFFCGDSHSGWQVSGDPEPAYLSHSPSVSVPLQSGALLVAASDPVVGVPLRATRPSGHYASPPLEDEHPQIKKLSVQSGFKSLRTPAKLVHQIMAKMYGKFQRSNVSLAGVLYPVAVVTIFGFRKLTSLLPRLWTRGRGERQKGTSLRRPLQNEDRDNYVLVPRIIGINNSDIGEDVWAIRFLSPSLAGTKGFGFAP
jgi:hypothetical protein